MGSVTLAEGDQHRPERSSRDGQPASAPLPLDLGITKEVLNELPLRRYEGPIEIVNRQEDLAKAITSLREETLLGFDTETRPCFKKGQSFPPALLQLAGETRVYLFQLLKLDDCRPLFSLLSDPSILKAGVAIRDDLRKLQDHAAFTPGGFVEIARLSQKMGILHTGLRNLAGIFLHCRISKSAQVTNWARSDLTEAQIRYAATDAWASREIYLRIAECGYGVGPGEETLPA